MEKQEVGSAGGADWVLVALVVMRGRLVDSLSIMRLPTLHHWSLRDISI